jgi:hypothetical protein
VQRCLSIVTVVANGCGPVVSPRTRKRLRSPSREQPPRTSHHRADAGSYTSSGSILVLLPLCFKLQALHYLGISFVTQELM